MHAKIRPLLAAGRGGRDGVNGHRAHRLLGGLCGRKARRVPALAASPVRRAQRALGAGRRLVSRETPQVPQIWEMVTTCSSRAAWSSLQHTDTHALTTALGHPCARLQPGRGRGKGRAQRLGRSRLKPRETEKKTNKREDLRRPRSRRWQRWATDPLRDLNWIDQKEELSRNRSVRPGAASRLRRSPNRGEEGRSGSPSGIAVFPGPFSPPAAAPPVRHLAVFTQRRCFASTWPGAPPRAAPPAALDRRLPSSPPSRLPQRSPSPESPIGPG